MKLINYNYGYNNTFECSIHGKIIVTRKEWQDIQKYLFNPAVNCCYISKEMLKEDLKRGIETKQGTLYNIRVTATDKVIYRFNISKSKRGNYMFLVKK